MKKLYKLTSLLPLIYLVSGCIGNNQVATESKSELTSLTKTNLQANTQDNQIPFLEVAPLQDDQCNIKLCNKESSVCAELKFCVSAQYAAGRGGNNYWVTQEDNITSGAFKLTFYQKGISSDFHLSDIYNDLQNNGEVGKIEQIDTRACRSLLEKGYNPGDSCNIDFIYLGTALNQKTNLIHFIFKSSLDRESLDFSFPVSNNYISNQNIPILDLAVNKPITYNYNSLSEVTGLQGLAYSSEYSQLLINNGIDPLLSFQDSHGDIDIFTSLATKMNVNFSPLYNRGGPSCGNNAVNSGETCWFNFSNANIVSSESGTSEFRRFAYQYSNNQKVRNITNTRYTILGIGDLIPEDYYINQVGAGQKPKFAINVNKKNYGNDGLSYNIPLKNMRFYLVYDPIFPIGTKSIESTYLAYAYGDYNGTDASNVISDAQINYDPNCFDVGFQINKNNNLAYDSCPVEITLEHGYANKPVQFQLWATYDSPVGKHINQLVGNIFVANSVPLPVPVNAICKSDSQFRTGFYDNEYRCYYDPLYKEWGGAGDGTYTAILDYNNCASGSGISNIVLRLDNGTNSPTYLQQLRCDTYNYKFPAGSYTEKCFNLSINGSILTASCKGLTKSEPYRPTFDVPVQSSIDFSQCSRGVSVDSATGKLECS